MSVCEQAVYNDEPDCKMAGFGQIWNFVAISGGFLAKKTLTESSISPTDNKDLIIKHIYLNRSLSSNNPASTTKKVFVRP